MIVICSCSPSYAEVFGYEASTQIDRFVINVIGPGDYVLRVVYSLSPLFSD